MNNEPDLERLRGVIESRRDEQTNRRNLIFTGQAGREQLPPQTRSALPASANVGYASMKGRR